MKYVGNKIRANHVSGHSHLVKALSHWAVVTQKVVSETLPLPPDKTTEERVSHCPVLCIRYFIYVPKNGHQVP